MPIPELPNVFAPEGAMDFHVSPRMRASLWALIEKNPQRLVVDLSGVSYIDSSGLAVLVAAMQRLEEDGGLFVLTGVPETVRTVLASAGLDSYFFIFPTVERALSAP